MSSVVKGTLVEAALGAVLITLLLLPYQAAFPAYAPYTPFAIMPIVLFFALRMPLPGLVAIALSFIAGTAWGFAFMLIGGPMIGANPASAPVVLGIGITVVIFLILTVHPLLLGRTPLAVVPVVLYGFLQMLVVMLVRPVVGEAALTPLVAIALFLYGCVMAAVMVPVSGAVAAKAAGRRDWRPAPPGADQAAPAPAGGEARR